MKQLENLLTEQINPETASIDGMNTLEILQAMNNEDKLVAYAVEKEIPNIALAVEKLAAIVKADGRLIYLGAGTSGRLGVLDAAECPPTFGFGENKIIGLIAGGREALVRSVEGAEDDGSQAVNQLRQLGIAPADAVVGIAASGRTPYVVEGIKYAGKIGAFTVAVSCSPHSEIAGLADVAITPLVGPEAICGSTRLKAGTAQKMVLNMITTSIAVKLGKVYGNLMVDLQPNNNKLVERAKRIIAQVTGVSQATAADCLVRSGYNAKVAIIMILRDCSADIARVLLTKADGHIRKALEMRDNL